MEVLNVRVDDFVKERLVAEANEREVSINDVSVGILAEHYSLRFTPTGRRSPGAAIGGGPLVLRVPASIWRKVDADAARQPKGSRSKVAVVNAIFRAYYEKRDKLAA